MGDLAALVCVVVWAELCQSPLGGHLQQGSSQGSHGTPGQVMDG